MTTVCVDVMTRASMQNT